MPVVLKTCCLHMALHSHLSHYASFASLQWEIVFAFGGSQAVSRSSSSSVHGKTKDVMLTNMYTGVARPTTYPYPGADLQAADMLH